MAGPRTRWRQSQKRVTPQLRTRHEQVAIYKMGVYRVAMRQVQMYNPTHRFDTQPESGPTSEPTVDWQHSFQSPVWEVSVWGGVVYLIIGQSIVAIETDGTGRWRFETDDWVRPSPAVVDGTLYIGGGDNHLYALDAATGREQWRFETDGRVYSSPTVVDDTVYVGSTDGAVYA